MTPKERLFNDVSGALRRHNLEKTQKTLGFHGLLGGPTRLRFAPTAAPKKQKTRSQTRVRGLSHGPLWPSQGTLPGHPESFKTLQFLLLSWLTPSRSEKDRHDTGKEIQAPRHDFSINFYVFLCLRAKSVPSYYIVK